MLTLHYLENSQSIRILWLLEELGAKEGKDYTFKRYERRKDNMLAPDDYKALSPLGTAPFITDGDLTLGETNAIMDYIMDRFDSAHLRPGVESPLRNRYLFWFHTAQGSFQPLMTDTFVFNAMKTQVPFFLKPITKAIVSRVESLFLGPRIKAMLGQIEAQLSEAKWFAGDEFTAADIVMGYTMEAAGLRGGMSKYNYPNAHRFIAAIYERDAFKRALNIDGAYDVMPGT